MLLGAIKVIVKTHNGYHFREHYLQVTYDVRDSILTSQKMLLSTASQHSYHLFLTADCVIVVNYTHIQESGLTADVPINHK